MKAQTQMTMLVAALASVGIPAGALLPDPKRKPIHQPTEADAARIATAQAKRERKAAKRATGTPGYRAATAEK